MVDKWPSTISKLLHQALPVVAELIVDDQMRETAGILGDDGGGGSAASTSAAEPAPDSAARAMAFGAGSVGARGLAASGGGGAFGLAATCGGALASCVGP